MVRAHPEIPGLVDWRPLARGGFSTVWQARQEHLDRLVAVKVDHRTLTEDKERRRFLREAGAAGRLSGHPGIVTVYDAGILDDGRPYLVMDLCPGGSLTRWLKPEGRQSQQRVRDVGVRIADALAAAHARGVLHRDVKPANILIDSYDNAGLADFGLAAMPEPGVDLSVTLEGMTPAYAPREVFYLKPPTEYGDVYSLAATLYALLDGKPPRWPDIGTPSLPELLDLHRNPIERLTNVDDAFMDLLLRAMDDDPEERLTAAQFSDELKALTFESPPRARVMGSPAAAPGEPALPVVADAVDPPAIAAPGSRPVAEAAVRSRRLPVAALLLVGGLIVTLLVVNLFTRGAAAGRNTTVADASSPPSAGVSEVPAGNNSPSSSPASPSPSQPTPSQPPAGFVDCSKQLGGQSYCLTEPECWGPLGDYADYPAVGKIEYCYKSHVDQTYAAGVLSKPVQLQSQLEAMPEVQALCTRKNLDKVLAGGKSLKDWQITKLPPQVSISSDNFFRCLFGTGVMRKGAIKLKVP